MDNEILTYYEGKTYKFIEIDEEYEKNIINNEIQKRKKELQQILNDSIILYQMIGSFDHLVQQQGNMIDFVEENISKSKDNVNAAKQELIVAKKYQHNYHKKILHITCGIIVGVTIGGGIGTIIGAKIVIGTIGACGGIITGYFY